MKRKIRISLSAFIALSVLGLALLVFIHYRTREAPPEFREDEKVQVRIDKVHYSGTKDGRIEWELDADSARRSREDDLTLFESVKVTFFAGDGTLYVLTARQGSFSEAAGEIGVSGGVYLATSREGYRLRTETLKYRIKDKQITTADRVVMTSDKVDVEGRGLLVMVETQEFRVLENVKAVFKVSGG